MSTEGNPPTTSPYPRVGITRYAAPLTLEIEFADAEQLAELAGLVDRGYLRVSASPALQQLGRALGAAYDDATYQEPVRERNPYAPMSRAR